MLLPGTDQAHAEVVAERLRAAVAALPLHTGETRLHVTCSVGVVTLTGSWTATHDAAAVALADRALYTAKASCRDGVAVAAVA